MLSNGRVYFYDIETRKEITLGNNKPGLPWCSTAEGGIKDGVRYIDTTLGVEVFDFETKTRRIVTAGTFPGRKVATKLWWPDEHAAGFEPEWRLLVSRDDGWAGNEVDVRAAHIQRAKLGTRARANQVPGGGVSASPVPGSP